MSSPEKPGYLGNFRDFPDYLEAISDKKSDVAPAESAAKRELRKLAEKNVAVKDRIQAFTANRAEDAAQRDRPRARRSLSRKISERMNVFECIEKAQQQQQPPLQKAGPGPSRSAVTPRAMIFGPVSAYRRKISTTSQDGSTTSQDGSTPIRAVRLEMATPFDPELALSHTEPTSRQDQNDDKEKDKEGAKDQWESDVHVTFAEDPSGAGRKCSIGKYALTPMPSMEDNEAKVDNNEEDEGLEVLRTPPAVASLDSLSADQLSEEYQKIEHQIQRISQEIDQETLRAGLVQEEGTSCGNGISSQRSSVISTEDVDKKDDEVHKTLKDFDEKMEMLEK